MRQCRGHCWPPRPGTGGIADAVPVLVRLSDKRTGAAVLYDENPAHLVDKLIEHYQEHHYKRPSVLARQAS